MSDKNPYKKGYKTQEETLATRRIKVDLSESKPKKPNRLGSKKQHKPQWFCHFCGGARHTQIALSCKIQSKQPNEKCLCQKHKILWYLFMNW